MSTANPGTVDLLALAAALDCNHDELVHAVSLEYQRTWTVTRREWPVSYGRFAWRRMRARMG